jgi:hypothetical protein
MWRIKHIFDGDFGCEDRSDNTETKVMVTLENDKGEQRMESVEDKWLTDNRLDVGSVWNFDNIGGK